MMGWQTGDQRQLFYLFNLERRIPASHLLRRINPIVMQVLADLREKLAPFYDLFRGFEQISTCNTGQIAERFCKLSLVNDATPPEERNLVDVIQQEMRQIHDLDYIPEPVVFGYADWSQYPFGGGWNSWNPGFKSWEVVEDIQALKKSAKSPEQNLYVIGEAYSQAQGWVEGAFQTAEQVLHAHFELTRPDWIPKEAYDDVLKVT